MVFAYIATNYFQEDERNPPHPSKKSPSALLTSTIADGDVITDWIYFIQILDVVSEGASEDSPIPRWLLMLQFLSCICGSISWFLVGTDDSKRSLTTHNTITTSTTASRQKKKWQFPVSIGTILLIGMIIEDLIQIMITYFIEQHIIESDNPPPNDTVSSTAIVNILFSAFDILHKLADAWDVSIDIQSVAYIVIQQSIKKKPPTYFITSSIVHTPSNYIIPSSRDRTVKLWDVERGECLQTFPCTSQILDVVTIGTSTNKVIAACADRCLHIFEYESGREEKNIDIGFMPHFISLHPDEQSFFISGYDGATSIQQRSLNTENDSYDVIFQYNRPATSIAFLDNDSFVSICCRSKDLHVWRLNEEEPIQTIQIVEDEIDDYAGFSILANYGVAVLSLSSASFLTVHGCLIKSWAISNDVWTFNGTFYGHDDNIYSLTKVNESLFVSTSEDCTAKLWSLDEESCLFTFRGHDATVQSCVYLEDERAIATGDLGGKMKVWSIAKYLKDEVHQIEDDAENP